MILEPAAAAAVGKCLVARLWKLGTFPDPASFHPRPCAWEDFSRADLVAMLDDFNGEAGYDPWRERYRNETVQRFHRLPRSQQAEMVRAAQYPEEE